MFVLNFEQWCSASDNFFVRERYYFKGRWTPFCKLKLRYFKSGKSMAMMPATKPSLPIKSNSHRLSGSALPITFRDEEGNYEMTFCDSISESRGHEDGMPAELTLVRIKNNKETHRKYVIDDSMLNRH